MDLCNQACLPHSLGRANSRFSSTSLLKYLQKTYEHKDLLADDALFKMADLYETVLNDKAKAQEKYQEIIFKFPGSIYVEEARKRFRTLRGDEKF